MIKVIAIGLMGTVLTIMVKQIRPEMAILVMVTTGAIILFYVIPALSQLVMGLDDVARRFKIDDTMLSVALKITIMAYLCEFGVAACKDAGAESIGKKIELFGKTSIFLLCIPIITEIISVLYQMVRP